ncbi:MAG: hypothetical protein AAGG09_01010 [Pseudomonadota bacterium]
MRMFIGFTLCLLAACASPREACLRAALSEVATLDRLIAETEANLARGYAIELEPFVTTGVDFCFGRGAYRHGFGTGFRYCNNVETRYREREVAIDPAAERRKLAELRKRRADLAPAAEARAAACPVG